MVFNKKIYRLSQTNLLDWKRKEKKQLACQRITGKNFSSVQFSSVAQSCPTLCDPMNCSMPGLPVHHRLLEFTETHIHRVGDAIQPSHPLSSPSLLAPNPSQHWSLFQWVNSSHEVLGTNFNIFYFRKWLLSYCSSWIVFISCNSMAHMTSMYKPWFCITKLVFLFQEFQVDLG